MQNSVAIARGLRRRQTEAETKLWSALRNKRFGLKRFRRQQPIGPYIADFYCPAAKLIVEVDGGQHGTDEGVARDAVRSRWLSERGISVIRFWNVDVLSNVRAVLESIDSKMMEMGVPVAEGEVPLIRPASPFGLRRAPSPSRGEGE